MRLVNDKRFIIFITAKMNKNPRGSYDATKGSHRNNINIQINFNMKEKNQAFAGKKIDNYLEVEHKNQPKTENVPRTADQHKKAKKKHSETNQKMEKEKPFDTPVKHRPHDISKLTKNNTSKTPEKKEQSRREERSKSTNQKLVKKKNAKSMENIKAGIRFTKNKGNSPSSSAEKSRSRSKSSKKMIRSNEQSAKKLHVFSNSGIKNKINSNSKPSKSRERQMSGFLKKQTQEEEHERLKRFMEEKKKKEKLEKSRHSKEDKSRKEKIQSELKKVELERKANASKPPVISKKLFAQTKERLPIYCFDDDFDESGDYDRLQEEASNLIHESPPRSNLLEGVPLSKHKDPERFISSSEKKSHKKKKRQLVYLYLNGSITSKQLKDLNRSVVTIQKWWRGCLGRKQFVKKLNDESVRIRYMKNKIGNKKGNFWNSEQENSIVNLERDSTIKINQSGSESLNYLNFNSHQQSDLSHQEHHLTPDEKNKTDRFKKLALHLEQEDGQASKQQSQRSERETYENSKMLKEIEELKKMLEKQSEKYRSLEQQNESLKQNIKILSLKESREIKEGNGSELVNSKDFFEIRMPKKIESPQNEGKVEDVTEESTLPKQSQQEAQNEPQDEAAGRFDLSEYKKQFQVFECSSPSNARLEEQLKKLKSKNIQNIFLKKELKIEEKYQKKSSIFDKMFQDKLFSPRTYNFKKKELQQNFKAEKEQIKEKIREAKEVIGFIDDISSEDSDRESAKHEIEKVTPHKEQETISRNFKKQKGQIYIDNSSQQKPQAEVPLEQKPEPLPDNNSHSSYSSEDDRIYKKYWTDDIEEVHKHTLEITKKIEQALKASSEEQSSHKQEELQKQYFSNEGYHSLGSNRQAEASTQKMKGHHHSKSSDFQGKVQNSKSAYKDYLQQSKEMEVDPAKKARQIFNKIDLSQQLESKSDEEMESSHDNICQLLNQRPLHVSPSGQEKPQHANLIISEAQFNSKKRKEQQLSRSSSFQKSNKSLSINNNSQVQTRGFVTNLTFIKEFCISVCQYIRNNENYKQEFIDKLVNATKLDGLELLRSYRVTISGEVKNNYNTFQDQYVYPYFKIITNKQHTISHELFNDFLKVYDEEKSSNPALNQATLTNNVKEMREYFLISIVDNFNESLEYEKPGSIYGHPLPWLHDSKHLKNHPVTSLKNASLPTEKRYYSGSSDEEQTEEEKRLDQIFGASIAKIIQWGSCLCGFIADPMPMEMGDSQIANLSDEQLMSIRENRVGLMLQKWLIQEEQAMTNSTSEYTEVLLFLGEKIIESLLLECGQDLSELVSRS